MITTLTKNNIVLRTLLLGSMALVTALILVMTPGALYVPGFSLLPSAHAAGKGRAVTEVPLPTLCASEPTGPHCENQDPIVQGCARDARTLAYKEMYDSQWKLLAVVERRYSPTCQSEWGRITQAPGIHQPLGVTIAHHPIRSTSGPAAFSTMVFVPNLSRASQIIGSVSASGLPPGEGGAGFEAILPALPPEHK